MVQRILELVHPRAGGARAEGTAFAAIAGEEVPAPFRALLVHEDDMTPTLTAYWGAPLGLCVLERREEAEVLYRRVLLTSGELPVVFGAIRIHLACLDEAARARVRAGSEPLGAILADEAVAHSSRPAGFFRARPDAEIRARFRMAAPAELYGRHNLLYDAHGGTLAEAVEILPPYGPDDLRWRPGT